MKNILKRGLSLVLALVMAVGLLPVTAFAAVDSSGKPTDLNNTLVLSIYTPEGSFPGEPAMHGSAEYISFNSNFAKTSASGKFKDNATSELNTSVLDDMVQGASNGSNTVWGVFSADGLKEKYFKPNASIIQPANEAKIIRVIKGNAVKNMTDAQILDEYEIIWYVIKLQHSPGNGWWNRGSTEWHIDGLIREKSETLVSINYYGNGNTEGAAPDGITNHVAGDDYTVLGSPNMKRKINGVYVDFLGWSAKADGTGEEAGFYKAGDVIKGLDENISLYAMWDTTTQYTATVNTYLDDVLTDDSDIHNTARNLYLGTEGHYYQLTRNAEGVYSVKITGNGKFHLFSKDSSGTYNQIGTYQLTIYNQNASLDIHHYSVTYNTDGGAFAADPGKQIYYDGDAVTSVTDIPTKEGYIFLGWKNQAGNLILPGEPVTASIEAPIVLTAQWEKTVNVTVNVTVNHNGGGGYDQMATKDDVSLALVSRENDSSPYLEVPEKALNLSDASHEGFTFKQEGNTTTYTGYTYTDMPGGQVDYTVVTSKSGYDTTIEPKQDADGNWIIDVVMTYNPSNFDVDFTVEVDSSVPDRYVPDAAIVKVAFWSTDRNRWEIITQQEGSAPGVRVDIDPATRSGSGSYPVWKYESNGTTPYGYRIQVTSFVYPDGTIVPASQVLTKDIAWTDNVYTATMDDVTGGRKFGTLDGAYIDDASNTQKGTLNAVITMDLHSVTFDAQGGLVTGHPVRTLTEQFRIPAFQDYVPTREGGYTFAGWYEDAACTIPATEGKDLTEDVTLYAKWIDPLTISGTVTVSGTYMQNGEKVSVHDIDRATEAVVVLQEIRHGVAYDVDSQTVSFGNYADTGSADYSFYPIPNDGKEYQIHVLVLNYGTGYDNESDANSNYSPNEYTAEFNGDDVADVDAYLEFVPPSYYQPLKVDATQIGQDFRPDGVLSEVLYRDTGDNHAFQRISQHDVAPYGVNIALVDGIGGGKESIWKWHTDGTLYEYQMYVTQVDGNSYDSDAAPYHIAYAAPAYWDSDTNTYSGELKATLIPKNYPVTFDLNAGEDTVTGMEFFKIEEEEGVYAYRDGHTWSHATEFSIVNANPQREGYNFLGWEVNVADVTVSDTAVSIPAEVQQEVVLKAVWERITYTVATTADPAAGGTVTGAGTYEYGSPVTIQATLNEGYTFLGWYENDTLVSEDLTYSFEIFHNHDFTAKFSLNQYLVSTSALPSEGGTTSGDGVYDYGTEITVAATLNPGYEFLGWYQDYDQLVTKDLSFQVTVTEKLSYVAQYKRCEYTVTTHADPAYGGTTSGDSTYFYNQTAIVKATANDGYTFLGWYDENGNQVSQEETYSFPVTADCALTAKFENIVYQVTVHAEQGGEAEGNATYHYGETATVAATTVDNTYTFGGWYDANGEKVSDEEIYTFTVTSDRDLTAKFTKNGFYVTATPEDAAYGSTGGSGYYDQGSTATVTATPSAGYQFQGWYEGATLVSGDASYSFVVNSNRTLVAKFARVYTIRTVASPAEGGAVTGGGQYSPTATATITAEADSGYYFIGWYDEKGDLVTADTTYSLTVLSDRTFTAKFEAKVAYRCDYVYLFGYNDSEIGATGPLLRGELAQMIYRLVKQNKGVSNGGNSFSDTAGEWFESGISYMAEVGAIDQSKASANPYATVTRGETYKMICLGLGFTSDTELSFSEYATILRNSGYLSDDGRVTARIARWEFCKLFNAILGRSGYCQNGYLDTNGNEVTAETYGYTDLQPSDSYYRIMMIATSTFTNGKIDLAKRIERNTYDYTR